MNRRLCSAVAAAGLLLSGVAHAEPAYGPSPLNVEPSPTVTYTPGAEIYAQYAYTSTSDPPTGTDSWDHAFDVPRIWGGLGLERGIVHARVLIEGVRSEGSSALVGVSGDSIVFRAREAWMSVRPTPWLEVRGGIVPTALVTFLDDAWRLGVLSPTAVEVQNVSAAADLGVQVRAAIPGNFGEAMVGIYNGEGYAQRELNRGKNTEASLFLHAPSGDLMPLTLALVGVIGSEGTGSVKANRYSAGLHWLAPRVRAGVAFTYADGFNSDGTRGAYVVEGSLRVEPVDHLLFAVRFADFDEDTNISGSSLRTFTGGVGFRFDEPLETWVVVDRSSPSSAYDAGHPGSDTWSLRVAASVAF